MEFAKPAGLAALLTFLAVCAVAQGGQSTMTIDETYPGLLSGALASAVPAELPPGILVALGKDEIGKEMLDGIVAKSPADLRAQLARNSIFLADELATKRLLFRAASEAAQAKGVTLEGKAEPDIITDYLQGLVADVTVTDAEIADYYRQNSAMFGGAALEKVKDNLRLYLRKMKRQEMVDRHIRSLGEKFAAKISAAWLTEQAARAMDNPVDKARKSGKVTLVDFGAESCQACQLMKPVLELLTKKYEGKANVLFVHVQKEPVLATRFGIRTIPVQVFFDKDGKELLRHEGFYPQEDIEKKLAEMGVQ
jgi:thioredoxin 1